jgi:hypothetical protein
LQSLRVSGATVSTTANAPTRPRDIPGSPLASQRHAYNLSLYFERLPKRLHKRELIDRVRELELKNQDRKLTEFDYQWLKKLYVASSPLNRAPMNVAWWMSWLNALRG